MLGVYVELGMRDTLLDIKFNRIKLFVHVFFIIIVNIARNDTLYLIYVIILLSLFGRSSSLLVISFALTVLRYFSTAANLEIPQMASVALLQYPYTPTLGSLVPVEQKSTFCSTNRRTITSVLLYTRNQRLQSVPSSH